MWINKKSFNLGQPMDRLDPDHRNKISTVLNFWFGVLNAMGLPSKKIAARWWQADPNFDD